MSKPHYSLGPNNGTPKPASVIGFGPHYVTFQAACIPTKPLCFQFLLFRRLPSFSSHWLQGRTTSVTKGYQLNPSNFQPYPLLHPRTDSHTPGGP